MHFISLIPTVFPGSVPIVYMPKGEEPVHMLKGAWFTGAWFTGACRQVIVTTILT